MFAVVVQFEIAPGKMAAFLPLMHNNAKLSLAEEAGCHQFDVLTDPDQEDRVMLYELYEDAAAFQTHLATPHFQSFDSAVAQMIVGKVVSTWRQVAQ